MQYPFDDLRAFDEGVHGVVRFSNLLVDTPQPSLRTSHQGYWLMTPPSPSEHVLRSTQSFGGPSTRPFRSRTSTNTLRVPSTKSNNENISVLPEQQLHQTGGLQPLHSSQVLGELQPNNQLLRPLNSNWRISPTPSMKKKKVEDLVKAHGSPTHVRVTAGGRIVPSEQSPLCHPRFGYSAIQVNGGLVKFAPNYHQGKPHWMEATEATEDGYVAQDINGNLCQIVNGIILPLQQVDGQYRLHKRAPNLHLTDQRPSLGLVNPVPALDNSQRVYVPPSEYAASEPSIQSQINALELEYSKLQAELKGIDQTEALHGRTMGKIPKDALVAKRRELVMRSDRIRKAIKELKNQPPSNAPTLPRAMRESISAPHARPLPFMQAQQGNIGFPHSRDAADTGPVPPMHLGSQPAFSSATFPPELYASQPWTLPPAAAYGAAQEFDASLASQFAGLTINARALADQENIPQNDGAGVTAMVRDGGPQRAHALSIKAPEPKPALSLKSSLNPKSPVYKPATKATEYSMSEATTMNAIKSRVPTPLSPLRQLLPPTSGQQTSQAADEPVSPVKKGDHLQSSSVSSFETADFFPRNTREYSTRQHAYQQSGQKENAGPEKYMFESAKDPATPSQQNYDSPQSGYKGPSAPPGTPVGKDVSATTETPNQRFEVPNREAHNVSPKSKREYIFVHENPAHVIAMPSSPPERMHDHQEQSKPATVSDEKIDLLNKSREWIEGYSAGLQRQEPGSRVGEFLFGYCAGLMRSTPAIAKAESTARVDVSPVKPGSHRSPIPSSHQSSRSQLHDKTAADTCQPFQSAAKSMDTLKQAVMAPHNEHAVLTPAADGMHINEAVPNLGAWAKNQHNYFGRGDVDNVQSYPFPIRASSTLERRMVMSGNRADTTRLEKPLPQSPTRTSEATPKSDRPYAVKSVADTASLSTPNVHDVAPRGMAARTTPKTDNPTSNVASIDSHMYGQWSNRILTPTEWKSGFSVTNAAGLSTGHVGNSQFDGPHRVTSFASEITIPQSSRFREGSIDGLSNSPTSPRVVGMSPIASGKRKEGSPSKGPSPAKAKFEHIAGKVGIKVSSSVKSNASSAGGTEPGSPPDKRRWRDIWRANKD